jgi:hypothetical protein
MNVNVCAILEEVIQVNERFLLALGGLCWTINFLFRRSLHVPHVNHVLTTHGKIFQPLVSLMFNFSES